MVANPEEITQISSTVPMISFDWDLHVIALTSIKLSERTLRFVNSKVNAMHRDDRIARAYAIRG
ncbi:hypothetical protein N665_0077s0053 [Sinapis alba]|nr:hypothetical protein N665_0077s0053 [Sinapis alba]